MTAAALVSELTAHGVTLSVCGDRLDVEGPEDALTPEVIATLRAAKPEILALLSGAVGGSPAHGRTARVIPEDGRATGQPWDADDWREFFDERVAVAMVCGRQSEHAARAVAWRCCITKWLDLHPVASDPSRCAHCGRADTPGNIAPFGTHAWLHSACWPAWYEARQQEAGAALREIRQIATYGPVAGPRKGNRS